MRDWHLSFFDWSKLRRCRLILPPTHNSDHRAMVVKMKAEGGVKQYRDGRKENHRGPVALFSDPCVHQQMAVNEAYKLAANEALVVYREETRPLLNFPF